MAIVIQLPVKNHRAVQTLIESSAAILDDFARRTDGNPYRNEEVARLLPADEIPALQAAILAAFRPAPLAHARRVCDAIVAENPKMARPFTDQGQADAFAAALAEDLSEYPSWVLDSARVQIRRTLKWFPSIAEVIEICEEVIAPMRRRSRALDRMAAEQRRRRTERENAQAKAEEEQRLAAERQERQEKQFGPAAPSPEDITQAREIRLVFYHRGRASTITLLMDASEESAPALCRCLAIARRAQLAAARGVINIGQATAIARLAAADELSARREVELIEAAPVTPLAAAGDGATARADDFENAVDAILAAAGCLPSGYPSIARSGFNTRDCDQRPLRDLSAELAAFQRRFAAVASDAPNL